MELKLELDYEQVENLVHQLPIEKQIQLANQILGREISSNESRIEKLRKFKGIFIEKNYQATEDDWYQQ